jgi:N-acetylmuramoyl-L-alanine amidase
LAASAAGPREASARSGEGIYGLLRRHGIEPAPAAVEAFLQLNQDRLGPNRTLILGRDYRLPSREAAKGPDPVPGGRLHYPLFGPRYAWVERKDRSLAGCILYLESGHGGPDPGAQAVREGRQLTEDEYAYDITLRLARVLMERGAEVFMIVRDENDGIRDEPYLEPDRDEVTHPDRVIPLNQMARLNQRAEAINVLYHQRRDRGHYHRAVIIHVDSRQQDNRVDVFFYHAPKSAAGQRLALSVREAFADNYRKHQPHRGYEGTVTARDLFMLRETDPPALFNIRNRNNQFRFIDYENRQALAEWIAEGIARDQAASRRR